MRFRRRVRLYGMRHLQSAHAAEDLAQNAMIVMLERLRDGGVREPDRIASFVLGVARMLVHEGRRGRGTEVPLVSEGDPGPTADPAMPDLFASARLAGCLASLAERERAVVVLTYYGEASARDVARTMGLAEGNVRVIRHRAIARLRECMSDGVEGAGDARREVAS